MSKIASLASALVLSALPLLAQTKAEDFRQPYPLGVQNNSENFTGDVWLSKLIQDDSLKLPAYNVTFAPGCINSWHSHAAGQVLLATAGVGYYQEQGKPARRLYPGDIVEIAPDVVHWHGAAPDSWFAHVALMPQIERNRTSWREPIGAEAYREAVASTATAPQKELTARQLAIADLGAYTGRGDLAGLRVALVRAFEAGMTQNEIKEVLTHAYAYAGFPRALRAIQTMMDVVKARQEAGISDPEGREASPIRARGDKYRRGAEILSKLTGAPASASQAGYALYVPTIERFLKEHLFADIFERDLLSYTERELATVSILAALGGVEPMAAGHLGICLNLGLTKAQLTTLFDHLDHGFGPRTTAPLRTILAGLRTK